MMNKNVLSNVLQCNISLLSSRPLRKKEERTVKKMADCNSSLPIIKKKICIAKIIFITIILIIYFTCFHINHQKNIGKFKILKTIIKQEYYRFI